MVRAGMLRVLAVLMLLVAAPAAAETLPPFSFADAQGRSLTLSDFAGRVVLLDFWASWCAPCVAEIPALDRLQRKYRAQGLAVVAVSIDKAGLPKVQLFRKLHGVTDLDTYLDDERIAAEAIGLRHIPASFLIGREGQILARFDGPHDWEADAALIERVLAPAPRLRTDGPPGPASRVR
jgi:thiol-disulfide isomerase/thioredoxin